jgi:hypothetical protein
MQVQGESGAPGVRVLVRWSSALKTQPFADWKDMLGVQCFHAQLPLFNSRIMTLQVCSYQMDAGGRARCRT